MVQLRSNQANHAWHGIDCWIFLADLHALLGSSRAAAVCFDAVAGRGTQQLSHKRHGGSGDYFVAWRFGAGALVLLPATSGSTAARIDSDECGRPTHAALLCHAIAGWVWRVDSGQFSVRR